MIYIVTDQGQKLLVNTLQILHVRPGDNGKAILWLTSREQIVCSQSFDEIRRVLQA